ncbi:MAG: GGDEF domain-containing protein [Gemmatimonadetes bacterium]|nr:GGDEF domain-containing protein [Gemmatimonadota bacterium]
MDAGRTLIIRGSPFEDPENERHAALIVFRGLEIGRDFRLRKNPMVIGRGEDVHIRLPDERASRRHAQVDFHGTDPGGDPIYRLRDLESTNHTFVEGREIHAVDLKDGDKIQIGDTVLKFVVLDAIEARFHAEVRDRISYDQLTGLLTKESLYVAFEQELERCLKYELPLSVLMMDLDRFKSVNDTHGHLMGSHVLAEVGEIIRRCIRSADVSARYGGEEFVTYLAETDQPGARLAAERIRTSIEEHTFVLDDVSIGVHISIGVSTAPQHGASIMELVGAADAALYRAKETGRNRVCLA